MSKGFFNTYNVSIRLRDHAAVYIAKCGCSTLKNIALYLCCGKWAFNGVAHLIDSTDVYVPTGSACSGRMFAVWRDPIDRIVSFHYNKVDVNGTGHRDWQYSDKFHRGATVEDTMAYVRSELGIQNVFEQDMHIRRQSSFYGIGDVDDIVPIQHLDAYLSALGLPIPPKHNNASSFKDASVFTPYEDEIRSLYADDYALMDSGKVWKNINL